MFTTVTKKNETESFEAVFRVKSSDVVGETHELKCESLRRSYERETNSGLIVEKIESTPLFGNFIIFKTYKFIRQFF